MPLLLDLYDDPALHVLRGHLARVHGEMPTKLASFQPEPEHQLDVLPDRLFALVGEVEGQRIRKYAMHSPEHVATSILYFLECGGILPDDVRTKVANNLIMACGWYDAAPPLALTKVAVLGTALNVGLAATAVPHKVRAMRAINELEDQGLRAAQMVGVKQAQRPVSANSEEEASKALDRFIRGEEEPEDLAGEWGQNYPNMFEDPKKIVKEADLRGTTAGAQGGLASDPRGKTPEKRFAISPKVSQWQSAGQFMPLEPVTEPARAEHYALPHRSLYPIDTPEQVKRASAYFDEYARDFPLEERRCFAQSVSMRAQELGVPVGGTISKLAGSGYGPYIVAELQGRINALEGTVKQAAYEVLLERIAEIPPVVMLDMLKTADEDTGIDQGYGRPVTGFKDPLSAVFGAPEKPIYSWSGKGAYVTEEVLRSFSKLVPDLDKVIEGGWSQKFVDDPIGSFQKLPDAKKIIVARLANGEAFRFI